MTRRRKGRRFELDIYNELKQLIPISLSKWTGVTKDEPGDLYTDKILIEAKRLKKVSDNQLSKWYTKLTKEAIHFNNKLPMLVYRLDYDTTTCLCSMKTMLLIHDYILHANNIDSVSQHRLDKLANYINLDILIKFKYDDLKELLVRIAGSDALGRKEKEGSV